MNLSLDSWQDWAIFATIVAAVLGQYWLRRKDRRETRAQTNDDVDQALGVKDTTIDSLKENNALLREQLIQAKADGERREEEWKHREAEWREERKEMQKRIDRLEDHYRNLVTTVTGMSYCARANDCANVDRGDRRGKADEKVGGTD